MNTVALNPSEREAIKQKTAKPLLYVGIVSIIMLFAGLTSAYVVRQAEDDWIRIDIPGMFYVSTLVIILSSISLFYGLKAAKNDNQQMVKKSLLITTLLGITFVITQIMAYDNLYNGGIVFGGSSAHVAGSFLYAITGVHLMHLLAGIIVLFVTSFNALKGKYNSQNLLGLELSSIYWHFLGALWIYLLLFLIFIR